MLAGNHYGVQLDSQSQELGRESTYGVGAWVSQLTELSQNEGYSLRGVPSVTQPKTWRLTVFLLKSSVHDEHSALRDPYSLQQVPLAKGLPFEGSLWVRDSKTSVPRWLEFLQEGIQGELPRLAVASAAAVLFVRTAGRIFALPFGTGRYLLRDGVYEPDFGLKVVLNSVHPKKLRSMDLKRFDEMTIHTRRQTSRGSNTTVFGVDVSRDVLRAVTGEPRDPGLARRIHGADAVILHAEIRFADLGHKCQMLLDAYQRDDYRDHFRWVDHLRPLRDSSQIATLDELVVQALQQGNIDKLHLAPPEIVDPEIIQYFKYSTQGSKDPNCHHDLDIAEYLNTLRNPNALSVEKLKRDRVKAYQDDPSSPVKTWSVYDCLVAELSQGDLLYVLTGGKWFVIDTDYVNNVTQRLKLLLRKPARLNLPPAFPNENENEYNERVATTYPSDFALLHKKTLRPSRGTSPIEACDLFTRNRQFVHVKRRHSSSTLSHLFAQGYVSAETFFSSSYFRKEFRQELQSMGSPLASELKEPPRKGDYEVVYAIIDKESTNWPFCLPFFTRANLVEVFRRFELLGIHASLIRIPMRSATEITAPITSLTAASKM